MALNRQEVETVMKRLKPRREDFGSAFIELIGEQLSAIDERLRVDVDAMSAFRKLRPLPDGDRVIMRNRAIWLIADHKAIRGNVVVDSSWVLANTLGALEFYDGQTERCPRPAGEMKLLNALVDYYVDLVVTERLAPATARWIDATTEAMLDAVRLPDPEFATVQALVRGVAQKVMVDQLSGLGQLDVNPAEIRKSPFKSFAR